VIKARYLSDDWYKRGKWRGLARRMNRSEDSLQAMRRRALDKLELMNQ
jgi:hypothetical protein